jgi:hypothetical protein
MTEPATPVDLVGALIRAFIEWDDAAFNMGERERRSKGRKKPTARTLEREAYAKHDAIKALGVDSRRLHQLVAEYRRHHIAGQPKGMTVGDAVQAALLELGHGAPHQTTNLKQLKEAG